MAEREVVVLCYLNCRIKHGLDGVYFEGSAPKEMRVKKKTDFSRFLDGLYLIAGLDKQKSNLEVFGRRPVVVSPNHFRYVLYGVMSDSSLETMLEVPSNHPSINTVEMFLEVKPTSGGDVIAASCSSLPMENPCRSSKRQKSTQQEVGDKDSGFNTSSCVGMWLDDDTMRVGLCFKDIGELKKAVDWWSIKRQKICLVRESDKDMYVFECARWRCKWSICAAKLEEDGLFEITKCCGPHTCSSGRSQDFKVKFLEYEMERALRVQPTLSTAELAKWWKEKFGYALDAVEELEHCAEGALQDAQAKAIERIFGDWDQSFIFMPKLMSVLHSSNGMLSFRGVFWAFSQFIQGFQHCRPLIIVDTKNLGGRYNMKLMIASGVDAANKYFPLAFAVTKEVTTDSWRWFLTGIREKITQRKGLCLISSPHPDILAVINEPGSQWQEPWAYHRFCLNHLCFQFCSVFPGYDYHMESLVREAGSSSQKEEFDSYMKQIKEKNPEAWKWLDQIPPHQWALSHDSGRRYGILKIKTKALFAVCRGFGKVAMAGGVVLLFGKLRDAFDESFSRSRGSLNRGKVYTKPVMEKLKEFTEVTCVITLLERDAFQSNESTSGIVKLNDSTCTCGEFQRNKFPCLHALALCDELKINPLQYVDECYTLERYHKTYAATFSPVPELSAWPEASGVPTLLPPVIEPPPPKVSGKWKKAEDDHFEEDDDEDEEEEDDDNDDEDEW
ncbi:hypothetical protein EUTSA_v10024064mg [Eutrema salsugineum]|uniref:SWIM-type domain-containing protein n=1 Tax=Eutrema salsugineum TaxID=72664 RepID=V4JU92_EUTSA|nr:hypothetical protein EUTSA_v10024064mg [Eutrema salsugineum]